MYFTLTEPLNVDTKFSLEMTNLYLDLINFTIEMIDSQDVASTLTTFVLFFFLFFLYLAALGLRCCTRAFSSCGEQGLLFVVVCGLLIAVASLVAEHGL